jgi:hypothetical protein
MYSGRGTRALPRVGFPIRKSPDQRSVSTFPGLIAAAHVLHRLLAPRHPPCALILLIRKNTCHVAMEFSRCARERSRPPRSPRPVVETGPGLSKLNSVRPLPTLRPFETRRGRRCSRRAGTPDGHRASSGHRRARRLRSNCSGFPRKEVIQPHLPVRLPCYDFTPITSPTFDGCLPKGLAHRLRVLPAFVV